MIIFLVDYDFERRSGSRGGSSKYKGVSWNKGKGKWRVMFNFQGPTFFIGYFADEIEAAKALASFREITWQLI